MKIILLNLAILASMATAVPQFGGPAAALGVIANLCGNEPPFACKCSEEEGSSNSDDTEDIADVEVVNGPLPPCLPKVCICPDGSEQPLPDLPEMITRKITKILDKVASRLASKLTKICKDGADPSICECENALAGELTFPVENEVDIVKCRPTRCSCSGQGPDGTDEWVTVHPGKVIFNQIMGNICKINSGNGLPDLTALENEVIVTPSKCRCGDGSEVSAPFEIKTMKRCKPNQCNCSDPDTGEDRDVEVDFGNMKEKLKFFKRKFDKLSKLCSDESAPVSCSCSGANANETITPPFDKPLEVLDCLPNKCTCENGEEISVKQTKPFNQFAKVCGDDMLPDTCTCEDGTTITPNEDIFNSPDDKPTGEDGGQIRKFIKSSRKKLKNIVKNCRPTSCSCPDGRTEIFTAFGCLKGGIPKCDNETGGGKNGKLFCQNGKRVEALKAVLAQSKGKCVCEDGIAPKCQNGDEPKCPDGSLPDLALAQVPDLLSQCKNE